MFFTVTLILYLYTSCLFVSLVNLLVDFYCDRLRDHFSVVPHVLSGLLALVRLNVVDMFNLAGFSEMFSLRSTL